MVNSIPTGCTAFSFALVLPLRPQQDLFCRLSQEHCQWMRLPCQVFVFRLVVAILTLRVMLVGVYLAITNSEKPSLFTRLQFLLPIRQVFHLPVPIPTTSTNFIKEELRLVQLSYNKIELDLLKTTMPYSLKEI